MTLRSFSRCNAALAILLAMAAIALAQPGPTTRPARIQSDPATLLLEVKAAHVPQGATERKLDDAQAIDVPSDPAKPIEWQCTPKTSGTYEVLVGYACPDDNAGRSYEIAIGDRKLAAKTVSTGGSSSVNSFIVGAIPLTEASATPIALSAAKEDGAHGTLMTLRNIVLKPATAEEIVRRREESPPPSTQADDPLIINVDVSDAPEMEDWAIGARRYLRHWYPLIAERLASDHFTPPKTVTLRFREKMRGIAATGGTTINIAAHYVKANPDDLGMVAHEATHVIQHYPKYDPVWLVEGIADYVRYYIVEPGTPRAHFDINKSSYKNGYQPAAGLLDYVQRTYGNNAIVRINAALREDTYKDDLFKELTGKDLDQLWQDFKQSKAAAPDRGHGAYKGRGGRDGPGRLGS